MISNRYLPKKISGIKNTDGKISLIGKVIKSDDNSFVLEDDTGKIEIFSDEEVKVNEIIKAFCSITDEKLKLDVVQKLDGIDLNLLKKVNELYRKAGV